MSANEFHAGVMIRCPGCGTEVHASQIGGDPDRPFRCESCRLRSSETAVRLAALHGPSEGIEHGQGITDSNAKNKPAKTRRDQGGTKSAQQQPTDADMDAFDVH